MRQTGPAARAGGAGFVLIAGLLCALAAAALPPPAAARPRLILLPYRASAPLQGGPLVESEPWSDAPHFLVADVDGDGHPDRIQAKSESVIVERLGARGIEVVGEASLPPRYGRRDLAFLREVEQRGTGWFRPSLALGQVQDVDGDGGPELVLTAATARVEAHALLVIDLASEDVELEVELPQGADRRQDGFWTGRWLPVGVLPAGQAGPHAAAVLCGQSHRAATGRGLLAVDLVSGEFLWHWESGAQPKDVWVGDLEGDGAWEIVCGTVSPNNLNGEAINGYSDDQALLLRFDARGRIAWQQRLGGTYQNAQLAVLDLDGDGRAEIVTGTSTATPGAEDHLEIRAPAGTLVTSRALEPGEMVHDLLAVRDAGPALIFTRQAPGRLRVYRWSGGDLVLQAARDLGVCEIRDLADVLPAAGPELLCGQPGKTVVLDRDLRPLLERKVPFPTLSEVLFWPGGDGRLQIIARGEHRVTFAVSATTPLVRAAPLLGLGAGVATLGGAGAALRRRRRRADPRPPGEILVHLLLDLCEDDGGGLQALGGLRRLVALGAGGIANGGADWARLWPAVRDADVPVIRDVLARAIEVDYEPRLAGATLEQLERLVRACERPGDGRAAEALARVESGLRQLRGRLQQYFSDDLLRRLEAVLGMLAPELERAGVGVRREGLVAGRWPELPPCLIDATDLRVILDNLIGNAIRAMREAPRRELTLRVAVEGATVRLVAMDTGCGMSEAQQERLFGVGHSQRRGGGFGLGHSRKLARRWGGDLELVASEPGRGSTFRLSLATAPEALVAPPAATERPVTGAARSALPRLLAEVRQLHHGGQALGRNLGRLVNALAASRATFAQVDRVPESVAGWHREFRERDLPRLLEVLDLAERAAGELARAGASGGGAGGPPFAAETLGRMREDLVGLGASLDQLAAGGWSVAATGQAHPDLRRRLRAIIGDFDRLQAVVMERCSCSLARVLAAAGLDDPEGSRDVRVQVPEDDLLAALRVACGRAETAGSPARAPLCTLESTFVNLAWTVPNAAGQAELAELRRRLETWGGQAELEPPRADGAPGLRLRLPVRS